MALLPCGRCPLLRHSMCGIAVGVRYDCLSLCLQHSLHLQLDISIELTERKIKGAPPADQDLAATSQYASGPPSASNGV